MKKLYPHMRGILSSITECGGELFWCTFGENDCRIDITVVGEFDLLRLKVLVSDTVLSSGISLTAKMLTSGDKPMCSLTLIDSNAVVYDAQATYNLIITECVDNGLNLLRVHENILPGMIVAYIEESTFRTDIPLFNKLSYIDVTYNTEHKIPVGVFKDGAYANKSTNVKCKKIAFQILTQ